MNFEVANDALEILKNLFGVFKAFPAKVSSSSKQTVTEGLHGYRPIKERSVLDRHKGDRRLSSPQQRLRYGFWKVYYHDKEAERTEFVTVAFYTRTAFYDILRKEAVKYHYYDRGTGLEVSCDTALNSALDYIWSNPDAVRDLASEHAAGQKQAQHLVNATAERLSSSWDVQMKETRRRGDRRATSVAKPGLMHLKDAA
jgi:hypothetical protein